MDRRHFFSLSGAGAVAIAAQSSLVPEAHGAGASPSPATSGLPPLKARLGHQMGRTQATDERLAFLARYGVEGICAGADVADPKRLYANADEMKQLRERVEKHRMTLDLTDSVLLTSSLIDREPNPSIMLAQSPQRDRDIEAFQNHIRACAAAGVPGIKYNMSILGVVRSGRTPGRGDAMYATWRLKDAPANQPLTRAGVVNADAFWERITYFLERVVPVATEHKIRLACHPHDPGVPPRGFRGIVRVLGTVEGMKRFVDISSSPYHGLNLCLGTTAEMLRYPNREIHDVIRYFGERRKIFNIHFRNIRGRRDEFQETFPDEGDMDMVAVMRSLKQVGYSFMVMPDHLPQHADDPQGDQAFAFGYGYIKALLQAV